MAKKTAFSIKVKELSLNSDIRSLQVKLKISKSKIGVSDLCAAQDIIPDLKAVLEGGMTQLIMEYMESGPKFLKSAKDHLPALKSTNQ